MKRKNDLDATGKNARPRLEDVHGILPIHPLFSQQPFLTTFTYTPPPPATPNGGDGRCLFEEPTVRLDSGHLHFF